MPRYLALLRGINVTGRAMIRMAELRLSVASLGFDNVASYINSGNIAFDGRKAVETTLIKKLEAVIERDFDLKVQVMVREQAEIPEIVRANPFAGEFESHKEMHVLFLREPVLEEKIEELRELAPAAERFALRNREIYCHLPMGVADSVMGRGLTEKKLKVAVTARNWRTVEALAKL